MSNIHTLHHASSRSSKPSGLYSSTVIQQTHKDARQLHRAANRSTGKKTAKRKLDARATGDEQLHAKQQIVNGVLKRNDVRSTETLDLVSTEAAQKIPDHIITGPSGGATSDCTGDINLVQAARERQRDQRSAFLDRIGSTQHTANKKQRVCRSS